MSVEWVYPRPTAFQVQGRDLSEDNFAQESRESLDIFMREVLQNALDARDVGGSDPVQVRMTLLQSGQFDCAFLRGLLNADYVKRLAASGGEQLSDFSKASILVIEDFGTTGLVGKCDDENADGCDENWNAFWFREGEGAKATRGSNGRAGQGKIALYSAGAARAVFGFTVRTTDRKALLMGRAAFRREYLYGESKYLRNSFWCSDAERPRPVVDGETISKFREAFGVRRGSESGLSLVIPFPAGFNGKSVIQTLVKEFYFPIASGSLQVSIGTQEITSSSIDSFADAVLPDKVASEQQSSFSKGFRRFAQDIIAAEQQGTTPVTLTKGWEKNPVLNGSSFPDDILQAMRTAAELGNRISVRCPITVRSRQSGAVESWFDVHLQIPDNLEHVEEAYIRRDLLIGSENHLAGSAHLQKARSLTLVRDPDLSAFLSDAEEPTHLRWNGSRPRLVENYSSPQITLRAVRLAAPRLLALLTNGLGRRDIKALAKYFTRPGEDGGKHSPGGPGRKGPQTPVPTPPPPSTRKPFRLATGKDAVHVLPNGAAAPTAESLPMSCDLELAYEGLDQDPFQAYDPFDFDLADSKAHPVQQLGIAALERAGNHIRFDVISPNFALEVSGFDSHIRLRARLTYKENNIGTGIDEE